MIMHYPESALTLPPQTLEPALDPPPAELTEPDSLSLPDDPDDDVMFPQDCLLSVLCPPLFQEYQRLMIDVLWGLPRDTPEGICVCEVMNATADVGLVLATAHQREGPRPRCPGRDHPQRVPGPAPVGYAPREDDR